MNNAPELVWGVDTSQPSIPSASDGGRAETRDVMPRAPQPCRASGSTTAEALAPLLLTSPLLRSFNTAQLRRLCDHGELIQLRPSEAIYVHGDEAAEVYLVVDGVIELKSVYGPYRSAGDLVGELAILSQARRRGAARAVGAATLLRVPAIILRGFLGAAPTALAGIDSVLVEMLGAAVLEQSGLGDVLGKDDLHHLAKHCALQSFACGDVIEGPSLDHKGAFVVVSGRISLTETYRQQEVAVNVLLEGVAFRLSENPTTRLLYARLDGWLLRLDHQLALDTMHGRPRARGG